MSVERLSPRMTGQVGAVRGFKNVAHMSAFGWIMAVALAIILLPLLPFAALLWLLGQAGSSGAEHEYGEIETEVESA